MSILIRNATILAMGGPHGREPFVGDIHIVGDRIQAIGPDIEGVEAETVIDGRDRLVMPGVERDGIGRRREAGRANFRDRVADHQYVARVGDARGSIDQLSAADDHALRHRSPLRFPQGWRVQRVCLGRAPRIAAPAGGAGAQILVSAPHVRAAAGRKMAFRLLLFSAGNERSAPCPS